MKKASTSPVRAEPTTPGVARRDASRETVEEAIARVRAMPGFLDEIGPEAIAEFQREAAKYPEVMGRLPPIKHGKRKR